MHSKRCIYILAISMLIGLVFIYKTFNPSNNIHFPQCPFLYLTGFKCPGCGSQRAVHHLLNLELIKSFKSNSLFMVSIPYLVFGFILENRKYTNNKLLSLRNKFYGIKAIYIVLIVIVLFWILRNILNI